eukprot:11001527-Alexandrium_andersonii.AAC.1
MCIRDRSSKGQIGGQAARECIPSCVRRGAEPPSLLATSPRRMREDGRRSPACSAGRASTSDQAVGGGQRDIR